MRDLVLNFVALIASLIAIYEFADTHPWTVYAAPCVFAGVAVAIYHRRLFAYWIVRRNLSLAQRLLFEAGVKPTLIIAFDRSSGIHAGMLAQRLALSKILVLPRSSQPSSSPGEATTIVVGDGLSIAPTPGEFDGSVILVFHLRTGATLEAGLEFLRRNGVQFSGRILTIYGTRGALARWPHTLCVHTITQNFVPNEEFPWMHGRYQHA